MSSWLALLSAFGVGAIASAVIQSLLALRSEKIRRSFNERKEAYVGLLQAYHRAAVEGTDEAAKNFAYWQIRCEIVGPESVRQAIVDLVRSNEDRHGRSRAEDNLKREIRLDLSISK